MGKEIENWDVHFELDKQQASVLLSGLYIYSKVCAVEIKGALKSIFHIFTNEKGDIFLPEADKYFEEYDRYLYKYYANCDPFESVKTLRNKFVSKIFMDSEDNILKFDINLTINDVFIISRMAELIIRTVIGQWWQLDIQMNEVFLYKEREHHFKDIRDEVTDFYTNRGIYGTNCSLGVHSKEVNDNVRILYDIKQILHFECFGGAFYPTPICSSTSHFVPKIEFPITFVMTFDGDDKKIEKALRGAKRYNDCTDLLWLPVKEYTFQKIEKGDKIYLKRNGYYIIEKAIEED